MMHRILISELKKIYTIRATYVLLILAVLAIGADAVLTSRNAAVAEEPILSHLLTMNALSAVTVAGTLAAVYAALIMSHEYRYSLIYHTLTAARTRSRSIAAKITTTIIVSSLFTALAIAVALIGTHIGVAIGGGELGTQAFDTLIVLRNALLYINGYALLGLLFAVYFRNIIIPIVLILVLPVMVEMLLSGTIGFIEAYHLPFGALQQLVTPESARSFSEALGVFLAYLVPAWLLGWWLYIKRDATSV